MSMGWKLADLRHSWVDGRCMFCDLRRMVSHARTVYVYPENGIASLEQAMRRAGPCRPRCTGSYVTAGGVCATAPC